MNNKEKYIAEVDSLKAGEELKNAILENAQLKPKKNVYKKIIPLAACLVIAVLVALPGFVFRAGNAKDAAPQAAEYVAEEVNGGNQAFDENAEFAQEPDGFENSAPADEKGNSDSKSAAGVAGHYASVLLPGSTRFVNLNEKEAAAVYTAFASASASADAFGEDGETVFFAVDGAEYSYNPSTGILLFNAKVYKLGADEKTAVDEIIGYYQP